MVTRVNDVNEMLDSLKNPSYLHSDAFIEAIQILQNANELELNQPIHLVTFRDKNIIDARVYLKSLRRTLLTSIVSMFLSCLIGILGVSSVIIYAVSGTTFINPFLSIFMILWAVGLLVVSIASSIYVKRDTESCISKILESCSPKF